MILDTSITDVDSFITNLAPSVGGTPLVATDGVFFADGDPDPNNAGQFLDETFFVYAGSDTAIDPTTISVDGTPAVFEIEVDDGHHNGSNEGSSAPISAFYSDDGAELTVVFDDPNADHHCAGCSIDKWEYNIRCWIDRNFWV